MRVAAIHDWLVTYGGADRVLEQILACYPDADLFSLVDFLPAHLRGFILHKPVKTTFVQHLPFARKSFRKYFPLMPLAVEQLDLSGYDLVLSNSHSIAKGVITGPDQTHICFCHSPARYAWELQHQYLAESHLDKGLKSWATRWMLHRARLWDLRTANGVDEFVANSQFIARRIWKVYRRHSTIIYPPVDVNTFSLHEQKDSYYVTVSRMVPYKRVKLIVQAFASMPERKLVVIGGGDQLQEIKAVATRNVEMLGYQDSGVIRDHLQRARAFIFAAEEDFGICVAEAQACGTPVIAFGKGGALEIVQDLAAEAPTGLFFYKQTTEAIIEAVRSFESQQHRFEPMDSRLNALRFSIDRFRQQFTDLCQKALEKSRKGPVQETAAISMLSSCN